jgi:hypothetical protein
MPHVCFCTFAFHAPYRKRARLLCGDAPDVPWAVLTDEPDDFADLPVRTIRHTPTGPMAVDYLERLPPTGQGRGATAYHDRRFALRAALEEFDIAVCVEADSRFTAPPPVDIRFAGLAVLPIIRRSIAEHLQVAGSWRLPYFVEFARQLTGDTAILERACWCYEPCFAVARDGREADFFSTWDRGARFLQERDVYSGEGGVIGLAAACAGWSPDFDALAGVAAVLTHEGGGPKET